MENLRLKGSISTTNMVLFSSEGKIKKYDTVYDIIEEFCGVRYRYYEKRKQNIVKNLDRELRFLRNKWRFINDVIEEKIILNRREEEEIVADLAQGGYEKFDAEDSTGFRYLLDMKIRSFTKQKLDELKSMIEKLSIRLEEVTNKSELDMWTDDLEEFLAHYKKWIKK